MICNRHQGLQCSLQQQCPEFSFEKNGGFSRSFHRLLNLQDNLMLIALTYTACAAQAMINEIKRKIQANWDTSWWKNCPECTLISLTGPIKLQFCKHRLFSISWFDNLDKQNMAKFWHLKYTLHFYVTFIYNICFINILKYVYLTLSIICT